MLSRLCCPLCFALLLALVSACSSPRPKHGISEGEGAILLLIVLSNPDPFGCSRDACPSEPTLPPPGEK